MGMSMILIVIHILLSLVQSQISPTTSNDQSETYSTSIASEYKDNTIICTKSNCQVICGTDNGCESTNIDASQSNTFTLTCSSVSSCKYINIISGGQISTEINCISNGACYVAQFNVANSQTIDLNCNYDQNAMSYFEGACSLSSLNATLSTAVTVNCNSTYSCYSSKIHCPSSDNSANQCNIKCADENGSCGGDAMFVYLKHVTSTVNLDCSTTECVSRFLCGTDASSRTDPSSELSYTAQSGWYCSTNWFGGCCPFINAILDCATQPIDCIIDCTTMDCANYLIDGATATHSLTVNCASDGGCNDAQIICPLTGSAVCNIDCKNAQACKGAIIKATDSYSLDLTCSGSESCSQIIVLPPTDAERVTKIDCSNDDHKICWGIQIWVIDGFQTNYLDIQCPKTADNSACGEIQFICGADGTPAVRSTSGTSLRFVTSKDLYQCNPNLTNVCCPWLWKIPITYQPSPAPTITVQTPQTTQQPTQTIITSPGLSAAVFFSSQTMPFITVLIFVIY